MKYEELPPISRNEVTDALESPGAVEAARAILRMSLHETDEAWAETVCANALRDRRSEVVAAAITGLGHLARIHRVLSNPAIVDELRNLQRDSRFSGKAEDALEDISMFASAATRAR
jgi:hypothetical protein